MNMHALTIMRNKAATQVFLDFHSSFAILSFCFFFSLLFIFVFLTQLFQGEEFHCPILGILHVCNTFLT
jgi:hypothetical protein